MYEQKNITFQGAVDIIESLPEYQQENPINLLTHRLIKCRRDTLTENIKAAKKEYIDGKVQTGTIDDLMKNILG